MAEPKDMVVPLLKEMRAEIAAIRKDVSIVRGEVSDFRDETRSQLKNIRSALAGDTILGRMLAADVEERLDLLEKKVATLESR